MLNGIERLILIPAKILHWKNFEAFSIHFVWQTDIFEINENIPFISAFEIWLFFLICVEFSIYITFI